VASQEHSYMRREFKIMKVDYNPIKGEGRMQQEKPIISKNIPKSIHLEVACDFTKSFKNLTKEI
jgi:hypothetical protein